MYIRRLRVGDSELLAATICTAIAEEERHESTIDLAFIDIDEHFRPRGIGTALVEALKRECVADGVDHIWVGTSVDNVAAQRLYVKTGGKHVETGMEYVYELDGGT